jgi:hypothetical protein
VQTVRLGSFSSVEAFDILLERLHDEINLGSFVPLPAVPISSARTGARCLGGDCQLRLDL